MKILCVTFEKPSRKYGGGLGIIQSLSSLSRFAEISYVGPEYDLNEFPEITVEKTFFLKRSTNVIDCGSNVLGGVPARYYTAWKKLSKRLDASVYDALFLDFSNYDFVTAWAKKNSLPVVTRVHNIESDMVRSTLKAKRFTKYKFRAMVNGKKVQKRENRCMHDSDKLVFLTEHDRARAIELYGKELEEKSVIVPVCLEVSTRKHCERLIEADYVLATGTLSYGANAEGISWFIENVWNPLQKENFHPELRLVVAGSHPNPDVLASTKAAKNCILVNTPEDMTPYFEHARFYVAPIFTGAGMKVKVAEAFSYGLKVVGAKHALLGYEEASKFYRLADTAETFIKGVTDFASETETSENKTECKKAFDRFYSMERSAETLSGLFKELIKE